MATIAADNEHMAEHPRAPLSENYLLGGTAQQRKDVLKKREKRDKQAEQPPSEQ